MSATKTKAEAKPAWQTAAIYAFRVALLGGLAWLGIQTGKSLQVLLGGPQVETTPADLAAQFDVQPQPETGVPDGSWRLAGLPWQMKSVRLSEIEAAAQFAADLNLRTLIEARQNLSGRTADANLARLAATMLPKLRQTGDVTIRALEQPGLKVAAFLAVREDREELIAGRVALRDEAGGWSLVEFTPAAELAANDSSESLLPLPDAAHRVAQRCDRQGRTWCDVILVDASLGELNETWQAAGWKLDSRPEVIGLEVQPTADRTEVKPASTARFSCRKGNEVIQVWYTANKQGGPATIVLTRAAPPKNAI